MEQAICRWTTAGDSRFLAVPMRKGTKMSAGTAAREQTCWLDEVPLRQREAAAVLRPRHTADIVGRRRLRPANGQRDRLRLIGRIGIERMLTGVENHQDVHFRPDLDEAARLRMAPDEPNPAARLDGHFA